MPLIVPNAVPASSLCSNTVLESVQFRNVLTVFLCRRSFFNGLPVLSFSSVFLCLCSVQKVYVCSHCVLAIFLFPCFVQTLYLCSHCVLTTFLCPCCVQTVHLCSHCVLTMFFAFVVFSVPVFTLCSNDVLCLCCVQCTRVHIVF